MEDKLIIFMHIPKTGGTTLNHIFTKLYSRNELYDHVPIEKMEEHFNQLTQQERETIKAISGHHFYGVHEFTDKPYIYFTMLREPVERVISLYYFLKDYPGYYKEKMKDMSFEEYIEWDPQAKNGQTLQICGTHLHSEISIEKAKERLNDFEVVGITEMFNESLSLLERRFGWSNIEYEKKNITKSRPKLQDIPEEIIKKIKINNQLDIELYEFVKSNLIKQLSYEENVEQNKPHGGKLINLFEPNFDYSLIEQEIELDNTALSDLELIGTGAYSPLEGFMINRDYKSVLENIRLSNGTVWSLPITLPISEEKSSQLHINKWVKLIKDGIVYGVLKLEELYKPDKKREAEEVYKTSDINHPGVNRLFERPDVYAGGKIKLIRKISRDKFAPYYMDPKETRKKFSELGWNKVVGFQTRNPIHRAHEYIQKSALEIVDGLFLNPLVGETKDDDISAEIRMER